MTKPPSPARSAKKMKPEFIDRDVRDMRLIRKAANAVPTNWCDSLLSGPEGIGAPPWSCRHIEQLLRGIQDRIRAITPAPAPKRRKK